MKKANVNEFLKIVGIVALVIIGWQLLNIITLGDLMFNLVEKIVTGVLSMSLYYNLKFWNSSST